MNEIYEIAKRFYLLGKIVDIKSYGNGLINKTYFVRTTKKKYIIQNINCYVFKDINSLMENIYIVTKYIKKKKGNTLDIVKTKDHQLLLKHNDNHYRCYIMKENSETYETLINNKDSIRLGKTIANFQYNLVDLEPSLLKYSIPYFHDLRHRYIDLVKSFRKCSNLKKQEQTKHMILEILKQYNTSMKLPILFEKGDIQKRICHYDTKLNNFLFMNNGDDCLIDLDTVMPGCSIYDYGDCARNIIVNVKEDDYDKNIELNIQRLIYLTCGYLSIGKNYLTTIEVDNLFNSIKIITLELSIRFLTDYLDGDLYFITNNENQNLYRALCQYKIYHKLVEEEQYIKKLVKLMYFRLTNIN